MPSPKCPNPSFSNNNLDNIVRTPEKSKNENTTIDMEESAPTTQVECTIPALVCYDISSGSEDETDPGLSVNWIKKEVPDPEEGKMEEDCDHNLMDEGQQEQEEMFLPAKESSKIPVDRADKAEVTVLQSYEHRDTIIIPSDTENDLGSGFSSDSEPDSTGTTSEKSSSKSSSEDDSSSDLSPDDDMTSVKSSDKLKENEQNERKGEEPTVNDSSAKKEQQQTQRKNKKTNPFEDDFELPPIEDLQISVEEEEAKAIGTIVQIVDSQVVIQAYPDLPAINLDSVLFVDRGSRALGRVFDVFGPVQQPLYVVRFTSAEQLKEKEVPKGTLVYYAPQTEHTNYVIMDELLGVRGSDASWKDNREPPVQFLDYSDDEEEKKAKQAHRNSRRAMKDSQCVIIHEFESRPKKPREGGMDPPRNPFVRNFEQKRSQSLPRIGRGSFFNQGPENYPVESRENWSSRQETYRPNVQFGAPPHFSAPPSPLPLFSSQSSHFSPNYHHRPPPSPELLPIRTMHHAPPPSHNERPHLSYIPNTPRLSNPANTPPPSPTHYQDSTTTRHHVSNTFPLPRPMQNSRDCPSFIRNDSHNHLHIQNAESPPQHIPNRPPPLHYPQNAPPPPHIQSTPPPPHIQSTPPPPHIQNIPPPQHIQNIPYPPHIQSIPPPQHIQNISHPPHIQSIPPPQHIQNITHPPQIQSIPPLQHIQNIPHPPVPLQNTNPRPSIHPVSFPLPPPLPNQPSSLSPLHYVNHQAHTPYSHASSSLPHPSSSSGYLTSSDPSSFFSRPPPPLSLLAPDFTIPPPPALPAHSPSSSI